MLVEAHRGQLGATSMLGFHLEELLDRWSIGGSSGIGEEEEESKCNIFSMLSWSCLCWNIIYSDIGNWDWWRPRGENWEREIWYYKVVWCGVWCVGFESQELKSMCVCVMGFKLRFAYGIVITTSRFQSFWNSIATVIVVVLAIFICGFPQYQEFWGI